MLILILLLYLNILLNQLLIIRIFLAPHPLLLVRPFALIFE